MSGSMAEDINHIKTIFKSHGIHYSNLWLESCVSWCREELGDAVANIQELTEKVYEQWLFLDLRDLEVPNLPLNLNQEKFKILHGVYSLQIMQIVDISRPKYQQLTKIRNSNILTNSLTDDSEISRHTNRMLQLMLTDGIQTIEAFEFMYVPCLNLNLKPGRKVKIKGPASVRRGRILLEPENIEVLGGEVDDLLISNALENVLARALNLPETDTPREILESVNDDHEVPSTESRTNLARNVTSTEFTNVPRSYKLNASDNGEVKRLVEQKRIELITHSTKKSKTPDIFDDDLNDIDFDTILESTKEFKDNSKNFLCDKNTKRSEVALDDEVTLDIDDKFNEIFEKSPPNRDEVRGSNDINNIDSVKTDSGPSSNKIVTSPPSNVVAIEKLLKMRPQITRGKFRVRARFKSVVEKLSVEKDCYNLSIEVEDDSDSLSCKVQSDLVTEFCGYTPIQLMELKQDVLNKNKKAEETLFLILEQIRKSLLSLDNVIEIFIDGKEATPLITKIWK